MLMTRERRPVFRTIEGWARLVLLEAGAIYECEEHGWAQRPRRPSRSGPRSRHGSPGSAAGHLSRCGGGGGSGNVGFH